MLRKKSKIFVAIILILLLISSFCYATSDTARTSDTPVATSEETNTEENNTATTQTNSNWTNTDLYLCQDTVNVSSIVDGNAFIIGRDITVSGEIGGDLFVIADKLTIDGGYIYSSIFACANEITINGVIYDVYANCATFNLDTNGFVYRDLRVNANTVNLNGKVRRNAEISAENIHFAEDIGTIIYGNLNYSSKAELSLASGLVSGEVTFDQDSNHSTGFLTAIINLLGNLFYTFVLVMILVWLAPKFVDRVSNMGVAKSFVSLGIGIAFPIVAFLVSILLILSVVGVNIFTSTIFASGLLFMFGLAMASLFFGGVLTRLFKQKGRVKLVLFALASNIILWALTLIPYIGWILSLIITLFGIGITLVNMVYRKDAVKKEVSEKETKKVKEKKETKKESKKLTETESKKDDK